MYCANLQCWSLVPCDAHHHEQKGKHNPPVSHQESVALNNGASMPLLGLGTWKSKPGEVRAAVTYALQLGYRHIDAAAAYGNQEEVGAAFQHAFANGLRRDELFVTSKLWNTCHSKQDVLPALKQTLKELSLDYLDLYLIHWPISFETGRGNFPTTPDGKVSFAPVPLPQVWRTMEAFQKSGKARTIGVSNFTVAQMQEISAVATVPISVNQVELTPYFVRGKLSAYCASQGILLTAFSPLGSPDRPAALVPAHAKERNLLQDPRVKAIAEKHGKSIAQVLIRYQIDKGRTVIPKSAKTERLKENFEVLNFSLPAADVAALDALDENLRMVQPPWFSYAPYSLDD